MEINKKEKKRNNIKEESTCDLYQFKNEKWIVIATIRIPEIKIITTTNFDKRFRKLLSNNMENTSK